MKQNISFVFLAFAWMATSCHQATLVPAKGSARQQMLKDYVSQFEATILKNWDVMNAFRDYPNKVVATGDLSTTIWVIVDQQGDVVATDIVQSSGHFFDREVQRAIMTSAPFPQPPSSLLYQSSRGLIAGFPLRLTYHQPGEAASLNQGRFISKNDTEVSLSPIEISR